MERHVFDHFDAIRLILSDAADRKRERAEHAVRAIGGRLHSILWDLAGSQQQITAMLRRGSRRGTTAGAPP